MTRRICWWRKPPTWKSRPPRCPCGTWRKGKDGRHRNCAQVWRATWKMAQEANK